MDSTTGQITPRRSLDDLRMVLVRQRWDQPAVNDVAGVVARGLEAAGALARIRPGTEIAITAGSRGIASMPVVLRAVIAAVRARGGRPFIFPAMGSHGGGTAPGQVEMLTSLGISEESMGVPIRATMDVVTLGHTAAGMPVYLDAIAARAEGIIVVNRVKKHTNFDAPIESGLCKMVVIGMGKHRQAVAVHQFGNAGLRDHIAPIAAVMFAQAPVLAGVGILENALGGVAELAILPPGEIVAAEPALLRRAKALSAKLPFQDMDIAVVERMGKEISGTGMDCYVIGRRRIIGEAEWDEAPRIRSLVLLDITEASHGNGVGVGLADFSTRRLVEKIDWQVTRANILTSGNLERGKVPLTYDTDHEALEAAAFRERSVPLDELRVVAMRDTLHLRYLLVSAALARAAAQREELEVMGEPMPLPLDAQGQWVSPLAGLE
ncbi:MAG: DUF2088 domain-containing protein [Chloroflexota bacterium]